MTILSKTTIVLLLLLLWELSFVGGQNRQKSPSPWRYLQACVYAQEAPGQENGPTLEWFKRELKISPKYQEQDVGIFGLSWAHFLVMVFLIVSFVIGLAALIVRYNRTKELLSMLMRKENADEEKG